MFAPDACRHDLQLRWCVQERPRRGRHACFSCWTELTSRLPAQIIANDQGNRITPSYVAFTESERLIGDAAKNQATVNPTNTVYDVKRLIGRS